MIAWPELPDPKIVNVVLRDVYRNLAVWLPKL